MIYDDSKESYFVSLQPGETIVLTDHYGNEIKTKTNNLEFSVLVDVEGYGFRRKK